MTRPNAVALAMHVVLAISRILPNMKLWPAQMQTQIAALHDSRVRKWHALLARKQRVAIAQAQNVRLQTRLRVARKTKPSAVL
jgi:hypothetical protein